MADAPVPPAEPADRTAAGTAPPPSTGAPGTEGGRAAKGNLDRETFRILFGHIRPHRWAILCGGLLSLVGGAAGLAQPLAVRTLVDKMGAGESLAGSLLLLSALVLAGGAMIALGSYVLERTAESVVLAARGRLVSRLLRLRISAVERLEPGDLMSRVTSDTVLLRQVTTQSVVALVTQTLTMAATVVLMGLMDPVLLGVTLGVIVFVGLIMGLVMPQISKATKKAQVAIGAMGATVERVLGAFRTVKASGAEVREGARVHEAAGEAWRQGVRVAKWNSLAGTAAFLVIQISFLAVLGVGGARVASGSMDVASLIAFLLFLFYLMGPIGELVQAVSQLQVGAAAVSRLREVDAMEVEPKPGPEPELGSAVSRGAVASGRTNGTGPLAVAFEGVEFRYRPELPLIHQGVDFAVPPGGMTAFVGPSGAGKSTVFSLIEAFYSPTAGRVRVGGRDVADWPVAELRAQIGYVEQDAPVLSGTLRENLLFAAPEATEEEIAGALRRTRLTGLIERLPDGLETVVGHRGSKLSGGERQRVAIARALLRKPRLMLLDEATSQLDAVNELALRDTVAEVARTATVLVVSHRLSTVTMADRIVVMDAGRVQAVGTHGELVAANPLYGELAATQFLVAEETVGPLRG